MIIEDTFTYHPPTPGQTKKYEEIRNGAKKFAYTILAKCPESAEKTIALRRLQECVMFANASIAINE